MHYDALLIDLDGVLRQWTVPEAPLENSFGLPLGTIRRVAFAADRLLPAITGDVTDEQWREQIAKELHDTFGCDGGLIVKQWSEYPGEVDTETIALVELCRKSMKIVLTTNATSRLPRDLRTLGLAEAFDHVVNSSEVRYAKPDHVFFKAALSMIGVSAAQALFIDDSRANVQAAAALGICSHHFVNGEAMAVFLHEAGVLGGTAV